MLVDAQFEFLLRVTDVAHFAIFTLRFVHYYRFSALTVVHAFTVYFRCSVAVAWEVGEICGTNVRGDLRVEISLEGLAEVGESVVGHVDAEPLEVVVVP